MSPDVTTSPATCYTVRNGWAWARIFIRHGKSQTDAGTPRGWVDVSILSDYGSLGFCWSHIGGEPWQEFLADLDFHYAMQKLMGERFQIHLPTDECITKGRAIVLRDRRDNGLDKADARTLWDALNDIDTDYPAEAFLSEWDRASSGAMYRNELWDASWKGPSPSAVGFWSEVWPHFVTAIKAERVAA